MSKTRLMATVLASCLVAAMASAQSYQHAQAKKDMTFSGTVESVNLKDHTFIVRNTENKNTIEEMKFRWGPDPTWLRIGTEQRPIDELQKGDYVTINWEPEKAMHMVTRVQRHKGEAAEHTMSAPKPFTFTGRVESVDAKNNTFVVRNEAQGKVEEMEFHLAPGTKLSLDGQAVLLSELERDAEVTVNYETVHTVKSAQGKKAT